MRLHACLERISVRSFVRFIHFPTLDPKRASPAAAAAALSLLNARSVKNRPFNGRMNRRGMRTHASAASWRAERNAALGATISQGHAPHSRAPADTNCMQERVIDLAAGQNSRGTYAAQIKARRSV